MSNADSERITRREFLGTNVAMGAGLAAALGRLPSGAAEAPAPPRTVGIGVIGVGGRGNGLMGLLLGLPAVAVRAVCDIVPERVKAAQDRVEAAGQPRPEGYGDSDLAWTRLCDRDDLDAVVIATPWEWHARMGVQAMKRGKYAAIEVPCAITLAECWDLVNTSEETGVPAMMLENWSFRSDNLAVLNMIRQGLLGQIVHCHCAHSHDCLGHWYFGAAKAWAGKYLTTHNCDLYPTHDLGPVLSWMDINCGDRFDYLTSTATNAFGPKDYFTRTQGADHPLARQTYTQGDIVSSVVRTVRGKTVVINNDMQLPRPYDNRWLIQGTHGLYDEERNAVYLDGISPAKEQWDPFPPYHEAFRHAWWQDPAGNDGHGGTDGLELRLFVEAVRQRGPTPLDVYDSVTMACVFPLSGDSIAKGSAPVQVPDFTRGKWETRRPYFALDTRTFTLPGAAPVTPTADGLQEQTFLLGLGAPRPALPGVEVRYTGQPSEFSGWPGTGGQPTHCLFSAEDWGVTIAVPPDSRGRVSVYAYDPEGLRRQSVVFGDRAPNDLDDFTAGVWLEYPFTPAEVRDGALRLTVRRRAGANAVLSRLKVALAAGR